MFHTCDLHGRLAIKRSGIQLALMCMFFAPYLVSKLYRTHINFLCTYKISYLSKSNRIVNSTTRSYDSILSEENESDSESRLWLPCALRADAATRLAALNDSSWHFLEATVGAFDEDYEVFSQCARAYLILRASRLVPGAAQATHHYTRVPTMRRPCPLPCPMSQSSSISLTMRSILSY